MNARTDFFAALETTRDAIAARPVIFLTLLLYVVLMAALGVWSQRKRKAQTQEKGVRSFVEEYFLAGRGMGGLALAMTIITTYTSASSFIGGPGVAYAYGLGWVALAMIQVPTTFLTLGLMGRKLAEFSRKTGAVTISDFLHQRYHSRLLATITSLFMIVFFVAIMLAQFIGGAWLFQVITGAPYLLGLGFFSIAVILYTTIGGFRAVILTDIVQGLVMLIASVAVLYGVIKAGGGLDLITDQLRAIDPGLLKPGGANDAIPLPFLMSFWILVGLGVLGLPQTVQKCLAFKDDRALRMAMIYGTIIIGFILLCTHLAGVLGRAVLPDLPAGDMVMPSLIMELMPSFWAGLFAAGVLAAIMSTVSSMLIIASSTLIRDLYIDWRLQGDIDRAHPALMRKISLGVTAFLGVLVFILALNPPDLLVWINLFAFGGLEAVFLWPILLGLYWSKANASGALSAVFAGLACFIALSVLKPYLWHIHPIVPSLAIAGLAFWIGNHFQKPNTL